MRRSRRRRRWGKLTDASLRAGRPHVIDEAATRPSTVCSAASTSTVRPSRRAVAEVTGPIEATSGGTPPAPTASTKRSTVDDEVKRHGVGPGHRRTVGLGRAARRRCGRPRPPRRPAGGPQARRAARRGPPPPVRAAPARRPRRGRERVEQRLGHEPLGNEVGHDVALGQRGRGARPDRRDPDPAQIAGVAQRGEQPLGAVGRGHHHPVELRQVGDRPGAGAAPPSVGIGRSSMTGSRHRLGPGRAQGGRHRRRLRAGPGHHHPATEQRSGLEPGRGSGRRPGRSRWCSGDSRWWSASVASVARTVRCSGRVPHRTAAAGVAGSSPPAIRRSAMLAQPAHPHQHHDGAAEARRPPPSRPRRRRRRPRGILVAGDHGEERRRVAQGEGDAGVGRHGDGRGHAGHHLEVTPAASRAAASSPPRANTNGSPPLSRTTCWPGPTPRHQQLGDLVLGHGGVPGCLAHVDQLGARPAPARAGSPPRGGRRRRRRPAPAARPPAR